MTNQSMRAVEVARVLSVEMAHAPTKLAIDRFEQYLKKIRH
jgi:hypothetical protein